MRERGREGEREREKVGNGAVEDGGSTHTAWRAELASSSSASPEGSVYPEQERSPWRQRYLTFNKRAIFAELGVLMSPKVYVPTFSLVVFSFSFNTVL